MIAAEDLTKTFSRKPGSACALNGVTFACRSGEILGIIGPNGAGKTTLMRVLATLIPADSGRATVAGHDVAADPDAVRENIGFVSPSHGLYERMTPRENVRYFGLLSGIPKRDIDAVVDDVLRSLSLGGDADVRVAALSTGMRQRASLARAIVHQPPVLLLDEPTNGLDVPSARIVLDFIRESRREGQAVIFCTHIMEHAEDVCDRVAVLDHGRIAAEGTLSELQARTGDKRLTDIFLKIWRAESAPGVARS